MSTSPSSIRRIDKSTRALGFERLLAQGLQQVQQISGEVWTDHNLHDPGITVLEQLCYALTELAYRADLPVPDHLAGPDGSIDLVALALHPPEQALPCRATTVADYRRLFLDRVEGLDDAHLQPDVSAPAAGVYRLSLKVASGAPTPRVAMEDAAGPTTRQRAEDPAKQEEADDLMKRLEAEDRARRKDAALRVYRAERNLCEDLSHVDFVADKRCDLRGDIEISGTREAAEILADIYHRAARWIDRGPRVLSRQELIEQREMDAVYDGPTVQVGFVKDEGRDEHRGARLYLADLANVLRGVDGVAEVHDLAIEAASPARADTSRGSVVRTGLNWALRLHIPRAAEEIRIGLRRRKLPVPSPRADELWRRVRNLRVADLAQRKRLEGALRKEETDAWPRGIYRPLAPHLSVQHDFPAVYALGKHALPASATVQRKARVQQLRAYLLMFDQLLANGHAQLHHLRDLYAVRDRRSSALAPLAPPDGAAVSGAGDRPAPADEHASGTNRQTYWWQALDAEGVPGLDELLNQTPGQMAREVSAFFDRSSARKSRLLDHLLALHGETLSQNALRQYCAHLRADELDRRLLDNKARFLEATVDLSRGRAGAFDYSRRLWNNPANFSGLARRMCLLLGFRFDHARPLTQGRGRGQPMVADEPAGASPAGLESMPADVSIVNVVDEPHATGASLQEQLSQLAADLPSLPRPLPASLLRSGASHEGHRMHTASATKTTVGVMFDAERWWPLGPRGTRADGRRLAAELRQALLDLDDASEGLHLVEHVLLSPPRASAHRDSQLRPAPDEDFYRLQLTVVMPNWTARTANKAFQSLAEETLRLNMPAHLHARPIRWLGYAQMARFERDWRRWLVLRQRWCRTPTSACESAMDAAACQVILWLLEPSSAGGA